MSGSSFGLEQVFLGLLSQHPTHAYDLFRLVSHDTDLRLIWRLKESHVYAILSKLEQEQFVAGEVIPQGTRPPRKLLHLTPAGEQLFLTWKRTPVQRARAFRQEFLAKLYFALEDGPQSTGELLHQQIHTCEQRYQDLHQELASLSSERTFAHAVLHFRVIQMEAILSWLHALSSSYLPASH
jgi:PadR family transcriptional regulator, regulatory protein AphA